MRQPEIAAASRVAATATTGGNQPLELPGWRAAPFDLRDSSGRADAERSARETDAGRQLQRCFPRWSRAFEHLRRTALRRLADNQPVDPNDADSWHSSDEHAQAVLRRHGLAQVHARRLQTSAIRALIDGQAHADRQAGLDWTTVTAPATRLDDALRRAHARLPIDLDDPRVWASRDDQRRALGRRLGVGDQQADDLSRWALEQPEAFDPRRPALLADRVGRPGWRSPTSSSRRSTASSGRSPCSSCPPIRGGWQLTPALSRRGDPADRRARRQRRPRPARRRRARIGDAGAAGTREPADPARRPQGVPGLGAAAGGRALAGARNHRQSRAPRGTSATAGAGCSCTGAATRARTGTGEANWNCAW